VSARVALAASLAAAAAGCSSQNPGGNSAGGLYGKVVIRPATPVCRAGTSCSKPAADLPLVFSQHGRIVASTRTDKRGDYRIRLEPGRYGVRVAGSRRAGKGLRPAAATVPEGRYGRLALTYDPGIR
jgi:hypothetical protein